MFLVRLVPAAGVEATLRSLVVPALPMCLAPFIRLALSFGDLLGSDPITEIELGRCSEPISACLRQQIPFIGFNKALGDAQFVLGHVAQIVLGHRIALVSRQVEPFRGRGVISGCALPVQM